MPFDTIVVKRDYTAPRFDLRIFTPEFHKPGVPQRPQRVDVQVPVRYRRRGDEPWSIGRTENLSRTGVLIRGVRLLPLQTPVEVMLNVPPGLVGEMDGDMAFIGTVARVVEAVGGSPGIGVAFLTARRLAGGADGTHA